MRCVERRHPILVDLSDHRCLARSQLTRDLVNKLGPDADVEEVADAPKQHAGRHADDNASRPAEDPDQRADQGANRCAGKIVRRLLDGQLAGSIFGDDGQSIEREIAR